MKGLLWFQSYVDKKKVLYSFYINCFVYFISSVYVVMFFLSDIVGCMV